MLGTLRGAFPGNSILPALVTRLLLRAPYCLPHSIRGWGCILEEAHPVLRVY
jgi:hypothetical protein